MGRLWTFRVKAKTFPGESVCVIGSCPELGSWENVQRLENQGSTESIGGEEAGEA